MHDIHTTEMSETLPPPFMPGKRKPGPNPSQVILETEHGVGTQEIGGSQVPACSVGHS
jgi:hypothetical protein